VRVVVLSDTHAPRRWRACPPTDRRRQPHGTLGVLHTEDGRLVEATIVPVT